MELASKKCEQLSQTVVRLSSKDRDWSGLEAFICDTAPGFRKSAPSVDHLVSMHLGPPVLSTCRCNGRSLPRLQTAGDLDVMPASASAAWHDEGPATTLIVRLYPSLMASVVKGTGASLDHAEPLLHVRDLRIEHIVWALKAELELEQPCGRLYAESLGIALCTQLLRRYGNTGAPQAPHLLPKRRIQHAIDYIHEHLDEELSITELAALTALSPSHFKLLFKESMGVPVHGYVMRARVDLAVNLITLGRLSLAEITARAGFANQSHMARCVRRFTGKSPSIIRDRF